MGENNDIGIKIDEPEEINWGKWGAIIMLLIFLASYAVNYYTRKNDHNVYIGNAIKELEVNINNASRISTTDFQESIKSGNVPLLNFKYQNLEKLTYFYKDRDVRENIMDYTTGMVEINNIIYLLTQPFSYNSQEARVTRANQVKTLVDFASSTETNSILLKQRIKYIQ